MQQLTKQDQYIFDDDNEDLSNIQVLCTFLSNDKQIQSGLQLYILMSTRNKIGWKVSCYIIAPSPIR